MFFRKATSVFIVIIFLFNIMGYYVVFALLQDRARGEMQERLASENNQNLELLVFSGTSAAEKIQWKTSNEFIYNGQLYDVKSVTEKNDSLVILCIHDSHEDQLFEGLRMMHASGKKLIASVCSLIIQIAIPEQGSAKIIETALASLLPDPSIPAERERPANPGNPPPKTIA